METAKKWWQWERQSGRHPVMAGGALIYIHVLSSWIRTLQIQLLTRIWCDVMTPYQGSSFIKATFFIGQRQIHTLFAELRHISKMRTIQNNVWFMHRSVSCIMPLSMGGVLRFELDRGVPLEPQNPYPSLRVILAEKGTHFSGFFLKNRPIFQKFPDFGGFRHAKPPKFGLSQKSWPMFKDFLVKNGTHV